MSDVTGDGRTATVSPSLHDPAPDGRTILIADDDRAIRTVLTQALGRAGYEVRTTGTAATLWTWVSDGAGDLVITDVVMPDENGLDLIPRIKKVRPELRIIVMSAQNTLLTAVKATERGAFEYLPKPFDLTELVNVVRRALSTPARPTAAPGVVDDDTDGLPLIGRSAAMQEIYRTLARLMNTDLTVMITGESGTGKELVARALHDYGKRRAGPFVAVNMAAIPRELIESELFGHEKGAFTGATTRGVGRFEQADGGTLFLDEIGDMPPEAQTRLLRVLQENEYTTVGGRTAIRANVRIVAATHRDLTQQIRQGLFREDLFYRLNVVPIRLPPLRERAEDIPELVRHFLAEVADEGLPAKALDGAAMDRLKRHRWPGNVRELENLVRRLAALYSQETIGVEVIEAELASTPPVLNSAGSSEGLSGLVERHLREYFAAHSDALPAAGLYDRVLREVERPLIALSLEATKGNQIKAAHLLGLNRNTLRKKIRELDIQVIRGVR
ncbi:nitrogen regulation protein NR(I) [Roseospira marina]|uniref:DNA-binding transcriptional regulator NtrC n=1 Tax=Roseospira marina TaxID=140057 RepID=A0A5M6IIB6_9PROT|nr:nitrogen regulation protein NR(I) [Roseospira marina]KAA5607308.1 nitrogen regulation protein NR(I) [Roseospira marina]MBB4312534.1 two-component system nitrogen regulation response regulator GlnG [Roseospira marina]MBB5085450.1 two-component system nitrogen regulation response regulator GlnG [Roseospira marina]